MKKAQWTLFALLVGALAPAGWAQTTQGANSRTTASQAQRRPVTKNPNSPSQNQNSEATAAAQAGTQISAELLTTLDARKVRPGREVVARVTKPVKQDGRTVIRKGSRLLGRVTSVQASGQGQEGSQIGVQFDRLAQGHAVSQLNTVVTAVFARPQPMPMSGAPGMEPPMAAPMPAGGGTSGGGGGVLGGTASTVGSVAGSTAGTVQRTAGGAGGAATGSGAAQGSGSAQGNAGALVPLRDVTVQPVSQTLGSVSGSASGSSQTSAGAKGNAGLGTGLANVTGGASGQAQQQTQASSLFSTRKGNLHLDSGTQMELQVTGQAHTQPTSPPQQPQKR